MQVRCQSLVARKAGELSGREVANSCVVVVRAERVAI